MQRDLNKEAFLWYTMTSPEYLDRSYAKLTEATGYLRARIKEHAFIMGYPPVSRWLGEMEKLEASYANARAMLEHGGHDTMRRWAGALKNIPRGFAESSMDWMPTEQAEHFKATLDRAYGIAARYMDVTLMSNLHFNDQDADWRIDEDQGYEGSKILYEWDEVASGITEIPEYAIDASLSCTTGELVPWTGVWGPAMGVGTSALAFARQGQIMQPAYEIVGEEKPGPVETRAIDVTWHPFRPTGRMQPVNHQETTHDPLRVPAGKPVSRAGYWFTPAKPSSRRYFRQGDAFPEVEGSSYGATFWQWSPDQSNPSLG